MKIIKKTVLVLLSLILIMAAPFSVNAATDYGDYDSGMVLPAWRIYSVEVTNGFMNGDFEQGLKYWATRNSQRPSDLVDVVKEGNNTFIQFKENQEWTSMMTPRFYFEKAAPGQQLVVIYDWRGSDNFQVYFSQVDGEKGEIFLGHKGGKVLYEAKNSKEWNTSITKPTSLVIPSNTGNHNCYLMIYVGVCDDKKVFAQIDNIRVGIMNINSGKVYDFDGNLIHPQAYENTKSDFEEALAGFGSKVPEQTVQERWPNRENPEDIKEDNKNQDKTDNTASDVKTDKTEDGGSSNNVILTVSIIVGAIVLLVIAALAVLVIITKNKQRQQN